MTLAVKVVLNPDTTNEESFENNIQAVLREKGPNAFAKSIRPRQRRSPLEVVLQVMFFEDSNLYDAPLSPTMGNSNDGENGLSIHLGFFFY